MLIKVLIIDKYYNNSNIILFFPEKQKKYTGGTLLIDVFFAELRFRVSRFHVSRLTKLNLCTQYKYVSLGLN